MREQHLNLLPLAARGLVGLGLGDVAGQVARAFMDRAQNLAGRCIGAAARFQRAWPAVARAGTVTDQVVVWHTSPRRREPPAVVLEGFPGRAAVSVTGVIVDITSCQRRYLQHAPRRERSPRGALQDGPFAASGRFRAMRRLKGKDLVQSGEAPSSVAVPVAALKRVMPRAL